MSWLPREGGACMAAGCDGSPLFQAAANFISKNKTWIMAAVAVAGSVKIYRFFRMRRLRAEWDSVGPNVVVHHTFPPGKLCPNLAPAALKLETFLRLANIQYKNEYTVPMGPKHKTPWVTINGTDIADSEIIIERLQAMFNKYPDAGVPRAQHAVAVAMRVMLEEHFYWGLVSWRYIEDQKAGLEKICTVPLWLKLVMKIYKRSAVKTLYLQGTGRHSFEEIHNFMKKDLEALSLHIGSKSFFHGDAPSVVDCAIFGSLCQVIYNCPDSPYEKYVKEELPNLVAYVERVKEKLWPDWEECLEKQPETI